MSKRCARRVLSAVLSGFPLCLYGSWCVAALDPSVEATVKLKVSAELLQLLNSEAPVDLAQVCEDEVASDSEARFKPLPLPDIVAHLRGGSASLAAGRLQPEPQLAEAKLVYVHEEKALGFIVVRFQPQRGGAFADQRAAVVTLALHPDVRHVEADCNYRRATASDDRAEESTQVAVRASRRAVHRPDPFFEDQWGLAMLPAPNAWKLADPRIRPLVAVLDSGVDCSNPELQDQLRGASASTSWPSSQQGPCPPGVGSDFVPPLDGDPSGCGVTGACNPHGTHMAAIIAAKTDNGLGIAAVAPNAVLLIVRTTDEAGRPTNLANRAGAIRYAVDEGAKVLNISQKWNNWSAPMMQSALAYAHGTLVNIAVGNEGMRLQAHPPNSFVNVTYVMALQTPHLLWPGSNRACWKHRSILAPGFQIHAAIVTGSMRKVTGTSPATAFVSGAHALLKSVPTYQNYTALQIHDLLFNSTPQASFDIQGATGPCKPQILCLASLAAGQCP
jgi:hypothetical protein